MDWQDWEHEREIAAHADLDSIYGIASHEREHEKDIVRLSQIMSGPRVSISHILHESSDECIKSAFASDEQREEAVRATECPNCGSESCATWLRLDKPCAPALSGIVAWAAHRHISKNAGRLIFLAWYVCVLAAATILGGYWYGR